jgi:PLP dependent protein
MTPLEDVEKRIADALKRSGKTQTVRLLAVSKTRPVSQIRELYTSGCIAFGENYVSEAIPKIHELSLLEWHFIGPLQSNKIPDVVRNFSVVQSVGRKKEIELLEKSASALGRTLPIYLQWDPGLEESKHGALASDIPLLALEVERSPHLVLSGLMMMAPNVALEQRRRYFQQAKALFDTLRSQYSCCTTLSMGMSDDFEMAIEEGSTMVRLGTLLFGER